MVDITSQAVGIGLTIYTVEIIKNLLVNKYSNQIKKWIPGLIVGVAIIVNTLGEGFFGSGFTEDILKLAAAGGIKTSILSSGIYGLVKTTLVKSKE